MRLAPKDAVRSAMLSDLIKNGGKCRYCGRTLYDKTLEKTPGVCSTTSCKRKAIRDFKKQRRRA